MSQNVISENIMPENVMSENVRPPTDTRLTNKAVADLLLQIANILQILEANRFRVIAFQNAAEKIKNLPRDIHALHAEGELQSIPALVRALPDCSKSC